jgi:osmotically-inducible protein OsmY
MMTAKINKIVITYLLLGSFIFSTSCVETTIAAGGVATAFAVREKSLEDTKYDMVISSKIVTQLIKNGLKEADNMVGINVNEGRVMLTGTVRDESKAQEAVNLCWKIENVKEVIDEIQIINQDLKIKDVSTVVTDSAITTEAKTKLMFDKKVSALNVQITTVNHIVYLLGVSKTKAELNQIITDISKIKGVKKVVSHIILTSDSRRIHQ